jgi:glycosyltransferase involved in cell wall biosynthesis
MILEKERDITFLCVGAGDSAKFESMVEAKNKQNVLFLGRQKNVESIMNICDIGVLLTNNDKHGEGISNAILEFQALGKPVIATIGGGNGEIIEDGQSGFLIKPKEPIELMEKIFFLLDKENERVVFGKNAVKIVVEKFNITRMIDEFKNVYNELIKF